LERLKRAEMLGKRARAREYEETRAGASSLPHKRADLGVEKEVKKEMLGRLAQKGGNERRSEERRDNGRFFESRYKPRPDE